MKSILALQALTLVASAANPTPVETSIIKKDDVAQSLLTKLEASNPKTIEDITTIIMNSKLTTEVKIKLCKKINQYIESKPNSYYWRENFPNQKTTSPRWVTPHGVDVTNRRTIISRRDVDKIGDFIKDVVGTGSDISGAIANAGI
ncbi:hypothetical protein [Mycoplasma todarodis]|uniref:Variable surface lipoprotein n=1 Tax=Mycoplasma todarodis TaxID=1937191 RepID=A0A4R0XR75_9MOLU|nr:hypothetical protein [Mycoplasma todarodis]TCG12110.1 hypothetical protein C4B25_00245 [Mycoplasma todarodis]